MIYERQEVDTRMYTREVWLSDDRLYRYKLAHTWARERTRCVFVMLNPSTADAMSDDPTIRKCVRLAKHWQCGSITVVNLFAWRSTNPIALYTAADPVGLDNDVMIADALVEPSRAALVVVAWGEKGSILNRDLEVLRRLRKARFGALCLGLTSSGMPKHPLARGRSRVPDDVLPDPYARPSN